MLIEEIDPANDDAFAEWYGVFDARQQFNWPGEPGWQLEELRVAWSGFDGSLESIGLLARDDSGNAVGSATVKLPYKENLQRAEVSIDVHPDHRRRGTGSELLAESERRVAAAGRNVIEVYQEEPGWRQADPGESAFPLRRGYSCALVNDRRDLELPVDADRLASLETAVRPFAAGYELIHFNDRYPPPYRSQRAGLAQTMSTAMPLGDTERDEETWDDARLSRFEETVAAQNRTLLATCAIDEATGVIVAFTEMAIPRAMPEVGQQFDTLVVAGHRGHRLGTLTKIANLRLLEKVSPATRRVTTWNARDNAPMVSINEALGYRLRGQVRVWQRRLQG
jgi:GNAT superfamily N-acetyltransferase